MSTSTPLIENIMVFLEAQLKEILLINNYRTNVNNVSRVILDWDELEDIDFPALMLVNASSDILPQTNKELEATDKLIVYGYIKYIHDGGSCEKTASTLLNELRSDVTEKLYDLFIKNKFDGNVEVFNVTTYNTDEGALEPIAIFKLECDIKIAYKAIDNGFKVQ